MEVSKLASENEKCDSADSEKDVTLSLTDLSNFVFKRVLSDHSETKSIFIEGSFRDQPGIAILILEKEAFAEDALKTLFQEENQINKAFQNDIYSSFRYLPKATFNGIKTTVIYPATEKHIKKYEFQPVHIVEETPVLYNTVTLPYLQGEQFSLQWVYNILEHKSESERIVYEDPDPDVGFILIPDLKWDGKAETLYLLALPLKRDILSLRDLTSQDLPLLRNIYQKGIKAIEEKYSLHKSQLRMYIHYQPTFYHFHVHFTYLQSAAVGSGTERSHVLSTVINNIELMSDYYQKATLPFTVKQTDNLFGKYEALGLLKRVSKSE